MDRYWCEGCGSRFDSYADLAIHMDDCGHLAKLREKATDEENLIECVASTLRDADDLHKKLAEYLVAAGVTEATWE